MTVKIDKLKNKGDWKCNCGHLLRCHVFESEGINIDGTVTLHYGQCQDCDCKGGWTNWDL